MWNAEDLAAVALPRRACTAISLVTILPQRGVAAVVLDSPATMNNHFGYSTGSMLRGLHLRPNTHQPSLARETSAIHHTISKDRTAVETTSQPVALCDFYQKTHPKERQGYANSASLVESFPRQKSQHGQAVRQARNDWAPSTGYTFSGRSSHDVSPPVNPATFRLSRSPSLLDKQSGFNTPAIEPSSSSHQTTPPPPKATPTNSTPRALPTVKDHTTDRLNATGDEYLPREIDEFGEKKIQPNGNLNGGREYKCRTFQVPNRGDKLFMLATECARVLQYRDSYLLFNKNRSLFKIIASQAEKDDLVQQEILPFSYRSRQIAIVAARSMFRQFGSRVIINGRRVRDDYWETQARKQGFTAADLSSAKRPGANRPLEAVEAQAQNFMPLDAHPEIASSNNPGAFPPQSLVQPGSHQ